MSNRIRFLLLLASLGIILLALGNSGCSRRSVETVGGPSSASTDEPNSFAPGKAVPAICAIVIVPAWVSPGSEVTDIAMTVNAFLYCEIRNVAGCHVKTLYHGAAEAGWLRLAWDKTNDDGERVESGVYFAHAEVRGFSWRGNAGFIIE